MSGQFDEKGIGLGSQLFQQILACSIDQVVDRDIPAGGNSMEFVAQRDRQTNSADDAFFGMDSGAGHKKHTLVRHSDKRALLRAQTGEIEDLQPTSLTGIKWKHMLPFLMETLDPLDLELRRRPTQDRALATFSLILDTTGTLLEVHGFDSLTTNLISAESGVSVRAIYRYFPNKHAIVSELARRMAGQWSDTLGELGSLDDPSQPWREVWCAYIDTFVHSVRSTPGGQAVLLAMRSDPDLRRIDDEANQRYIAGIAAELTSRSNSLGRAEAERVATVLMRSTVAVLDDAFEATAPMARQLIQLLKTMQLGLLADYLD